VVMCQHTALSSTCPRCSESFPMVSSPRSSILGSWSSKFAAFKVEDLFSRKRSPGLKRTVFINENLPDDYYDQRGRVKKEHIYATNQVITSKYTIITFLPRNILEQFRRIANMCVSNTYLLLYHLMISCL